MSRAKCSGTGKKAKTGTKVGTGTEAKTRMGTEQRFPRAAQIRDVIRRLTAGNKAGSRPFPFYHRYKETGGKNQHKSA